MSAILVPKTVTLWFALRKLRSAVRAQPESLLVAVDQEHDERDEGSSYPKSTGYSCHPMLHLPNVRRRRRIGRLKSLAQCSFYRGGMAQSVSVLHESVPGDPGQYDDKTKRDEYRHPPDRIR